MSQKNNTSLALGNFSMRSGNFEEAIRRYVKVLSEVPSLGRSISVNFALAKKRYRNARRNIEKQSVGVCGWDLAHNCAGRAYALALVYREFADVEIIGSVFPQFGSAVWEPIRDTSIAKHYFIVDDESRFLEQAIELVAAHPYDIVHLSKPRAPNILIGILYKLIWSSKVLVDVDDEELGFVGADEAIGIDDYLKQYPQIREINDLPGKDWTRLAVGMAKVFDGVTVVNDALKKRYGGEIIRHARDGRKFDLSLHQKQRSREKYGIPVDKKVVLFLGTPRRHKGLKEVAEAIAALERRDILFVVVGDFPNSSLKAELQEVKGCNFVFIGNQPFDDIPAVTAIADCSVLLQSSEKEARYQVPAKLTDSLAMGVPVICSETPGIADLKCEALIFVRDKVQLRNALEHCLSLDDRAVQENSASSRRFFEKNLSIESQVSILRELCSVSGQVKDVDPNIYSLVNAFSSNLVVNSLVDIAQFAGGITDSRLEQDASSNFTDVEVVHRDGVRGIVTKKYDLGIIILNLNGAPLLARLFESISRNSPELSFRIFVTDHASTDGSRQVLDYWSNILPIDVYYAPENYSFSFSNNRWAERLVGCDKLLFLNNDIVFERDVLTKMASLLRDPTVGVVGVDQWEPSDEQGTRRWHHCGIGFKWDAQYRFWRPFNMKSRGSDKCEHVRTVPAVTGSVMMVRRNDFIGLGGFDEGYNYGYEDVDLCLGIKNKLRKKSVCMTSSDVIHADGVTRKKTPSGELKQQRLGNIELLQKKYTGTITRIYRQSLLGGQPLAQTAPRIAFAVTEVGRDASAGDLFTAMELGQSLESEFGWHVEYRPRGDQWYSLTDVDIVVAMVDAYDPRRVRDAHPGLVKIAWARNWFERWCDREWHDEYDVYLASSELSANYFEERLGQAPRVLRIGTNPQRFNTDLRKDVAMTDFVFAGSYWNAERQIVGALASLPKTVRGVIYGKNWEKVPELNALSKGFLPYDQLPQVYRDAKIAIDDANHVTKPWGSVNSRVFDALAAGCLVVTNSQLASDDAFDGELPVYETPDELIELLSKYSTDAGLRENLVQKLRRRVLGEHTYVHRAYEFKSHLREHLSSALRFSIKIPVPKRELAQEWGDYHFATSLARELRAHGNSVRIDFLTDWGRGDLEGDDVTLVLRGLSEYKVRPWQYNIVWLISHPEKVSDEELNTYDRVFVASTHYADKLSERLRSPVHALLQCTDDRRFNSRAFSAENAPAADLLFVGNSRNQFRKIIKDALTVGLTPDIYGTRWEKFVPSEMIKMQNVSNSDLPGYYAKAGVVLNDHWPDMAANGFLSNRLFDAVACGANVISDRCEGLGDVFGDSVLVYDSPSDLVKLVQSANQSSYDYRRARASAKIRSNNSFRARAIDILSLINLA
ncbi:glycosyltransferase [Burkholderia territorii]|uniref:glycosyltransferase family protein n=1 Tax=Burkholderia territorii TaxID=1503055 RepID=UPI000AA9469A|nr:glycosyltransferase [Burkholderia territorii]